MADPTGALNLQSVAGGMFSGFQANYAMPIIIIVVLLLVAGGMALLIRQKKSYNVKVTRFEARANGTFQLAEFKAKKTTDSDGVVKYKMLSGNMFTKPLEIKPENDKDEHGNIIGSTVFDYGNFDGLMLFKDIHGDYFHIRFRPEYNRFELVPAEVRYWGSLAIRESNLNHQTGIDWKIVGIYAMCFVSLVISLIMFLYAIDHATKIVQGGVNVQQVPVTGGVPTK